MWKWWWGGFKWKSLCCYRHSNEKMFQMQVIQTRISQCLWWTAWIPSRLKSGIVCSGMGSGDFLRTFLGICQMSPGAKPSDLAQRSLCCDNLSFNESIHAWFFGDVEIRWYLYMQVVEQKQQAGSSKTGTLIANCYILNRSCTGSHPLFWQSSHHFDKKLQQCFIWTPMTCCWCKKYQEILHQKLQFCKKIFSGLDGTLMDTVIYCPYQLGFLRFLPQVQLVRAVRAVYRPPSMVCTWYPGYLGIIELTFEHGWIKLHHKRMRVKDIFHFSSLRVVLFVFIWNTKTLQFLQVMFENPTVADLTDFIVAQFSEGDDEVEGAVGGRFLYGGSSKGLDMCENW